MRALPMFTIKNANDEEEFWRAIDYTKERLIMKEISDNAARITEQLILGVLRLQITYDQAIGMLRGQGKVGSNDNSRKGYPRRDWRTLQDMLQRVDVATCQPVLYVRAKNQRSPPPPTTHVASEADTPLAPSPPPAGDETSETD